MPRCAGPRTSLYVLKASLFLISCTGIATTLLWLWLVPDSKILVHEAIENVKNNLRYIDVYRKTNHLPKELKYILLWARRDISPFNCFPDGQKTFIKHNCSVINCYVTSDKNFFDGDTIRFDAIAFNGRFPKDNLPKHRSGHQKFIYCNLESADNYPVCNKKMDGFFNWTFTYRLDSDIPFPAIMVRNSVGKVVGPKKDMKWPSDFLEISEEYEKKLASKSKAAAWIVSNCWAKSKRNDYVKRLMSSLAVYNHTVDVYGRCGPLNCTWSTCKKLLQRDYYFYLSFENSIAEDYVTEKVLTALQNDAVPIVFGGADYSRFIPPDSYIDARKYSPFELANIMVRLMNSPKLYQKFFRWKGHFHFSCHDYYWICDVCAALNDQRFDKVTVYEHFRKWWYPDFNKRC